MPPPHSHLSLLCCHPASLPPFPLAAPPHHATVNGSSSPAASPRGSGAQLAAALERMQALERQNAELRQMAAEKDTVLAESRKFIEGYLQRSASAAEQRQAAFHNSSGSSSGGGGGSSSGAGVDQQASRGAR